MKKPALILSAVLLFAAAGSTQAQGFRRNAVKDPKANMGVKVGFNSTMFFIDHFAVGGNELSHIQNNYKVGYFGAFFCRFNLKKHHFIQTEVSYNVLHGSISIPDSYSVLRPQSSEKSPDKFPAVCGIFPVSRWKALQRWYLFLHTVWKRNNSACSYSMFCQIFSDV